jgi:hypothetical protein
LHGPFRNQLHEGWLERQYQGRGALPRALWQGTSWDAECHRYQTNIIQDGKRWVAYYPGGHPIFRLEFPSEIIPEYFQAYCARINAAGWRPEGSFPSGIDMAGIDLLRTHLPVHLLNGVSIRYGRISNAFFVGCYLTKSDLSHCEANGVILAHATIKAVSFEGVDLQSANFNEAHLESAVLIQANFARVAAGDSLWVNVDREQLHGADLTSAQFVDRIYTIADSS